jgi:peptidoglycan/xylan/chitin deacetylase (PgdA/CDA1 family)
VIEHPCGKAALGRLAALRRLGVRRATLAAGRLYVERHALAFGRQLRRPPSRHGGRILCYHAVGTSAWGVNDVSAGDLRRHIQTALALGFRFVPADDIHRTGGAPRDLAITFDDGLASVARNATPVLQEFHVPWTMFVVTDWADGRHAFGPNVFLGWREIERLAARGSAIGSHSVSHPNFGRISRMQAEDELGRSRRTIEERLGVATTQFAIPFGQSRDWPPAAQAVARATGYTAVYAQSERRRPPGTVARTFVTRFDDDRLFRAALNGAFDAWEEWF